MNTSPIPLGPLKIGSRRPGWTARTDPRTSVLLIVALAGLKTHVDMLSDMAQACVRSVMVVVHFCDLCLPVRAVSGRSSNERPQSSDSRELGPERIFAQPGSTSAPRSGYQPGRSQNIGDQHQMRRGTPTLSPYQVPRLTHHGPNSPRLVLKAGQPIYQSRTTH